MKQGIILLFGLFVILGCGYQDTSTESPIPDPTSPPPKTNYQKILPKKISVDFPEILKNTLNYNSGERQLEEKKESNLHQLEKDIYKVEDVIEIAELNLILLKQVMPEILEHCEGIERCVFEDRELSFQLDEKIIGSIDKVLGTKNRNFLDKNGTLISLGAVEFSKHENQKYEYELEFNMLNSSFVEQNSSIQEQKQLFKWSNSSSYVVSTYLYSGGVDTTSSTLRYFMNSEGKELMYISDKSDSDVSIESTTLVLKKTDDNLSYALTSNTTIQQLSFNETNTSHFSTNMEMNANSTQILLLDKNSSVERSMVTERDDPLDMELVATKPILVTGPGVDVYTLPSNSIFIGELKEKLTLFVFEVDAEGLASGDYLLLNPDINIEELTLEELVDASIGSFSVMEGKPQGALYNDEFLDRLSELTIVKIIDSQESTEGFEFLVIENKPKLNIVKK
ncbi:MAG: hypothetical protein DSZ11_05135 [Sulfurovum sp.]|nr:MAG: hypothetical protein DSZ11_05135 [Sulfurovum sp.]